MTCILYIVVCGDLMAGTFPDGPLDSRWVSSIVSCLFTFDIKDFYSKIKVVDLKDIGWVTRLGALMVWSDLLGYCWFIGNILDSYDQLTAKLCAKLGTCVDVDIYNGLALTLCINLIFFTSTITQIFKNFLTFQHIFSHNSWQNSTNF